MFHQLEHMAANVHMYEPLRGSLGENLHLVTLEEFWRESLKSKEAREGFRDALVELLGK